MAGYQSDIIQAGETNNGTIINTSKFIRITPSRISDTISVRSNERSMQIINQNLVVNYNVKVLRIGGVGRLENGIVKMPIPLLGDVKDSINGSMTTELGDTVNYRLNAKTGVLQITGEITQRLDAIIFQFQPYVAKFPLEYDPRTVQQIINDL